jgi:hypothetical protein
MATNNPVPGSYQAREPLWRTVLCWGAVSLFLILPILILIIRLMSDSFPNMHWGETISQAKFVIPYFQSLTALVFGLAGLNVWDRKNGRNNSKKE